jgi:predicted ATPase
MGLWLLGYPDRALQQSQRAVALARECAHPFSLAYAQVGTAAIVHQFRKEAHLVQEHAEAGGLFSREQGFPFFMALGTLLRGWALVELGQGEEGIARIYEGMATWRATGAKVARSYWLALLAEAHGKVGRVEEGRTLLAKAREKVERTGSSGTRRSCIG